MPEERSKQKMTLEDWVMLPSNLAFAVGVMLPLWQCANWLKTGVWEARSVGYVLYYLSGNASFWRWFESPDDWVGLHRVLRLIFWFPVSVVLIAVGIWLSAVLPPLADKLVVTLARTSGGTKAR